MNHTLHPSANRSASLLGMLHSAQLALPLTLLTLGLGAAWVAGVAHSYFPLWVHTLAWIVVVIGLLVTLNRLHRHLFLPLVAMQNSLYHFNQGTPGVRIGDGRTGVLDGMAKDINSLIEELADLYDDMDTRVARQTKRLAEKTASLKILYDMANNINEARSLDELLIRFLRVLKEMVNARSATVQLLGADNRMRMIASLGLDNEILRDNALLPIRLCRCGVALTPGDILCEHDPDQCSGLQGRPMFGPQEIELIEVQMPYHEEVLGLYRLYVPRGGGAGREEVMQLLHTIGRHLGMAVAKQRSDEEAYRFSIVEERTALAHELHDSLAQTLASLRFQVRMLAETLEQPDGCLQARTDLLRISNGLDEAHTELRDLLSSYRAPAEPKGLMPALEKVVQRFREETGIGLFLQSDCRRPVLSSSEELQLLRIVQESLANIRKHAQAHTVRILLRCRPSGQYELLVEDDGVGFESAVRKGHPGEHIGLSILEERARRLNGSLRIESEPGEGTRVELVFQSSGRSGTAISSRL